MLPEFSEGGTVEIPMTYTLDKDDKNISISYDEEELRSGRRIGRSVHGRNVGKCTESRDNIL